MIGPATASAAPLTPMLLRQRVLLLGVLALVVAASWAYLARMAAGMGGAGGAMLAPCAEMPGMARGGGGPSLSALPMWSAMALAMMLPTALPLVLLFGRSWRGRFPAGGIALPVAQLVMGYLAVWVAFGAAASLLQHGLERAGLATPMMGKLSSAALGGATLVGVGVFQLTPLKAACLARCRSPLMFLMTRWRVGRLGPLRMGLDHGLFCLGCCWALMLVMLVVGVMNLVWMAALTVTMTLEKVLRRGEWIVRGSGVAALGAGAWMLLGPG